VTIGLLALVVVALISTAAASFINIPSFKGTSPLRRDLVSLLTLGVGVCFYLVSSTWPQTECRLRLTLQLVNWSGLVMLVWALAQGYFWYRQESIPQIMNDIQSVVSLQGFYYHRANGFAYEPSWFGHQLNMVYLPLWLAATLQRYSAHRFRLFYISFENILLGLGLVAFFLSSSRIGLLAILLVIAFLVLIGTKSLIGKIQTIVKDRLSTAVVGGWAAKFLLPAVLVLAFFSLYLSGAFGLVYTASRLDPRMARLFDPSSISTNPYAYANQLQFAERVVFWGTGWEIFNNHPLLGVGLGNAGYYFPEKMPALGWGLTEINTVMYRGTAIPNTKSLWARLLAETGIVGFVFWIGWLYLLWQAARFLRKGDIPLLRTIGLAGALVLVALLAEGFSVDSFALPYFWFSFGLVSAGSALLVTRQSQQRDEIPPRLVMH
jgi:O-antigen ligase